MSPVEFDPEALKEIEDGAEWYEAQSVGLGGDFVEECREAFQSIQTSPETWSPHTHQTRIFLLHRFPFGVIYHVEINRILILAVAHLHRRPGYWAKRLRR